MHDKQFIFPQNSRRDAGDAARFRQHVRVRRVEEIVGRADRLGQCERNAAATRRIRAARRLDHLARQPSAAFRFAGDLDNEVQTTPFDVALYQRGRIETADIDRRFLPRAIDDT